MTKKQVLKFLKDTRNEAMKNLNEQHAKVKIQAHNEIADAVCVSKYAKDVHEKFQELSKAYEAFEVATKLVTGKTCQIKFCSVGNMKSTYLTEEQTFNSLKSCINFSEIDSKLDEKYRGLIIKCSSEYEKLYCCVENMASAKEAVKYLESLGFDLSAIAVNPKEQKTAIGPVIDTKWLFLDKIKEVE